MTRVVPTKRIKNPAAPFYALIISVALLSIVGVIMVFSASSIYSLDTKGSAGAIFIRQLVFLVISIPMAIFLASLSLKSWKSLARFGLIFSIVILIALRIPGVGKTVNGNTNWISLGVVDVQPSELAKFLVILWASQMLATRLNAGFIRINVLALIAPGFIVVSGLIMWGRDLGTASVTMAILGGILFVSGIHLKLIGTLVASAAIALAFFIVTAPYRAARWSVFLDPFDPAQYKNEGWQPAHSLLGLASGGIFGVGLGGSRQKWGNLPEAHTDFIFAIIGEELGLVGTLFILALLGTLIYSILRISISSDDSFTRFACAGIASWIAIQSVLNIGSALSLLPVVGVTLPLVSYGGSALIATYMGVGFVASSALRNPAILVEVKRAVAKRRAHK
jgi:cell division protein FtsW